MRDQRAARLADLLVNYCVGVRPGDWCIITGELVTTPLARELLRAILEVGGHPASMLQDPEMQVIKFATATDDQLDVASPVYQFAMERADVLFNLEGTTNTRRLTNFDPQKVARNQRANQKAVETFFRRSNSGELRWVVTRFPTQADAQESDMSLLEFEDFVYKACFLNKDDPIAAWRSLRDDQQRIVDWLSGKKSVHVEGTNLELSMSIEGRAFINADGTKNMPSGEVFTSPIEQSVSGWIEFSYPAILQGREVKGVRLEISEGRVVEATAQKGEEFLLSQIDQDEGARVIGEFAIGTNYGIDRFTGDSLFDEKIGGTIHLALGQGIEEAGGQNKSMIHWDMVTDMKNGGRIQVDGELLYENGRFTI